MGAALIITTVSDHKQAQKISRLLVSSGAAACATAIRANSTYVWKEDLQEESEFVILFKTVSENVSRLKAEIQKNHPYDTPEILEIPILSANKSYLDWLAASACLNESASQPS